MDAHLLVHYAIIRPLRARRRQSVSKRSILCRSMMMVMHPRYISVGAHSGIRDGARLEVILRPEVMRVPRLAMGDHVNIEQGRHISCRGQVTIEDHVSITPYCVIADTDHPNNDPDQPPKIGSRLNTCADSFVRIGQGSFIGAHSIIMPNVDIGCGCVIGAGSVVTRSVPDYSLVVGAPARVVRRFNIVTRVWEAVS